MKRTLLTSLLVGALLAPTTTAHADDTAADDTLADDAPAAIVIVPVEVEPTPAHAPAPAVCTVDCDAPTLEYVVIEAEASDVAAHDDAMLAPVDGASPGVFAFGLSGLFGTRDDAHGDLAPTWMAGLDLSLAIVPWLRVVARRMGYGHARSLAGDRHAITMSPAVELALRVAERLEPYIQLGAALQARFGGAQDRAFGVAPFLDGGLRVYLAHWVSVSVEGALHVPVTSAFLVGHEIVPQGGLVFQGGLAVAFHP